MEEIIDDINSNSEKEKVTGKKEKNKELINLIEKAKGTDRTYMAYARAAGISTAAFTRINNGDYTPTLATMKKLTSEAAAPRGGVTFEDLMRTAGYDVADGYMNDDISEKFSSNDNSETTNNVNSNNDTKDVEFSKSSVVYRSRRQEIEDLTEEYISMIYKALVEDGFLFKKIQPDMYRRGFRADLIIEIVDNPIKTWMFEIKHTPSGFGGMGLSSIFMRLGYYLRLDVPDNMKLSLVIDDERTFNYFKEKVKSLAFRGEVSIILYSPEKRAFIDEVYLSNYYLEDTSREIYLVNNRAD